MPILDTFQRSAFRRFRNGQPGPWGGVAAALFGVRMLKKWGTRNEEVVYRQVLVPGQEINLSHLTTSRQELAKMDRKALKAAKRQAKAAKKEAKAAKKAAKVERREAKIAKKLARSAKREARVEKKALKVTRRAGRRARKAARAHPDA